MVSYLKKLKNVGPTSIPEARVTGVCAHKVGTINSVKECTSS